LSHSAARTAPSANLFDYARHDGVRECRQASGSDDVFAFGVADAVRRDFDVDAGVSSFEDLP